MKSLGFQRHGEVGASRHRLNGELGAAPYDAGSQHKIPFLQFLHIAASGPGGLAELWSRCRVGREAGWQCHWPYGRDTEWRASKHVASEPPGAAVWEG